MSKRFLMAGLVMAVVFVQAACIVPAAVGNIVLPYPLMAGSAPSFSLSGDADVPAGKIHQGDLVSIFGDVRVEGTVTGQIVVILGSLEMNGTANDQVVSVLSETSIGETARIHGDLVNIGWDLERHAGSEVSGEVINVGFMRVLPFVHHGDGWASLLWLFFLFKLALHSLFFLAVLLVTALVPRRLEVIATAFPEKWAWALLTGLLVYAGVLVASFILLCTVIGIPLAGALIATTKVVKWLGLASLFFLVGGSVGRNLFKRELSHLPAVLGGFALYSVLWLVPFVGALFALVLNIFAVGIVVVTRFGSEESWGQGRGHAPTPPAAGPPAGSPPAPPPVAAISPPVSGG